VLRRRASVDGGRVSNSLEVSVVHTIIVFYPSSPGLTKQPLILK
jgi:hypothetical protein